MRAATSSSSAYVCTLQLMITLKSPTAATASDVTAAAANYVENFAPLHCRLHWRV